MDEKILNELRRKICYSNIINDQECPFNAHTNEGACDCIDVCVIPAKNNDSTLFVLNDMMLPDILEEMRQ